MFKTEHYSSRYFNQIIDSGDTLIKKSDNVKKIVSEYSFYYLLPDYLKRFFIQPFNLVEEEDSASYEMEKVQIPNSAQLLLSEQLEKESFFALISKVSEFQAKAGLVKSTKEQVMAQARYLVLEKTATRLDGLGYETELARLEGAFDKYSNERTTWNLALSHGDLCLSNILWVEEIGMMKLIDPRGADSVEDLFLDEYYDMAKLAHSIFSGYESILYGVGEIPTFAKETLTSYLEFREVPLNLLKVYEAALFLSMIPLHAESPERMKLFKETAENILDTIGF